MLQRFLGLAGLACCAPFCVAIQPPAATPCLASSAADSSKPGATPPAIAALTPAVPDDRSLDAAATPSSSCKTTDAAQSNGSSNAAAVFEFRFAPDAPSPMIPDALSPSRNLPHGKVYGLLGSTLIGAPDLTLRDELPIDEFGASLGGNIGKGATAYFVSFDQLGFSQRNLLQFLTDMQHQTGSSALTLNANPAITGAFTARIDRQFGQRDSAYVRFNRDSLHNYSLRPGEGANVSSLTGDFGLKQQTAAAGNTVILSPNTVNETSAQFISTDVQLPAGASAMGVESTLPTLRRDRVFEAATNIYRQVAGQSVRAGGDFLYNQMNLSFIESGLGRNSSFSQSDRSEGLYVQNEKRIHSNLLLTSGIRYEVQSLRGFKTDTNNLAPQVGFSWAPASRTVIRGGVGMYYDQVPLPIIAGPSSLGGAANIQDSSRLVVGKDFSPSQLAMFTVASPTMQNSYAEQADIGVEQQIGAKSFLSTETQYIRGVQLALPETRFTPLCASTSDCQAGNTFGAREIGTGAVSSYHGTSVAFTENPVRWGNYKVSYTYATAESNGTGENTAFLDDRLRRVSFTGVLHTSGDPGSDIWQHVSHGFVLTGTGDYASRSEFAGMNFINFNARIAKTLAWGQNYRLDLVSETFNMFERTNAAFANSAARMGDGAALIFNTYQRVAAFQSPNGSQFGLRLVF